MALAQKLSVAEEVGDCVGESVGERDAESLRVAAEGEGGGESVAL